MAKWKLQYARRQREREALDAARFEKEWAARKLAEILDDPETKVEVREHSCPPGNEKTCDCAWVTI